jgi:hypothetical protein
MKPEITIAGIGRPLDLALEHLALVALQGVLDDPWMDIAELAVAGGNDFDHLRDHVARIESALLVADQAVGHVAHHVALGEIDIVVEPTEGVLGHRFIVRPGLPRRRSLPTDDRVIMIVSDEQAEALFSLEALKPYATEKSAHLSLPPLSAPEIQRAIAVQSNDAGLRIDAEVVGDLAREIQGEPAAFSLAHFMLFHLWPLSRDGFIGWDDYKKLGRPNEALARIAEDTFKRLSAEEQDAAKRLFLMLAAPGVDTTATSRSVRRTDLVVGNPDAMARVLQHFEDQRLLRRSLRPDVDADAIKMVSDRLMYRWNRLAEWLAGQRRNSERRLQVLATARLWDRSDRSAGYLFTDKKSIAARWTVDFSLGYTPVTASPLRSCSGLSTPIRIRSRSAQSPLSCILLSPSEPS